MNFVSCYFSFSGVQKEWLNYEWLSFSHKEHAFFCRACVLFYEKHQNYSGGGSKYTTEKFTMRPYRNFKDLKVNYVHLMYLFYTSILYQDPNNRLIGIFISLLEIIVGVKSKPSLLILVKIVIVCRCN